MVIVSVLLAILAFGFLIFTHELGHFIAARIFGVKVHEFSIGFGPRLVWYTSKKSGTKYSLAMLPFGGFVSMEGEDEASGDPNALSSKPAWQRLIIMAAGATVNLLTGILLMFALVLSTPVGSTVVADHPENLAGDVSTAAVLQEGDRIISIAGRSVHIAQEMDYVIMRKGHEPVEVVVVRDGVELTLQVQFPKTETDGQVIGSRDFRVYTDEKTPGTVLKHTYYQSVNTVRMVWESIYDLITGRFTLAAVSGPVGITGAISGAMSQEGFAFYQRLLTLASFMAVIAINLGVVNLLPIPALDGGRVVFLLIEMVFRRPVPQHIESTIHGVAMLLLLLFILFITVKDVIGIFV